MTSAGAKTPLEAKQDEIANYRRILNNYQGRWYDSGRRHLAELEAELHELERASQAAEATNPPA